VNVGFIAPHLAAREQQILDSWSHKYTNETFIEDGALQPLGGA